MVDEKKCYLFGRNQQLNDFCIDHASCSRVHAALVYHKHLNRAFLVDLGSSKFIAYISTSIYNLSINLQLIYDLQSLIEKDCVKNFCTTFSQELIIFFSTWDLYWQFAFRSK